MAKRVKRKRRWGKWSISLVRNYFVELHNHGIEEQAKLVPELLRLAKKFDLVANDVHYVKGGLGPHDALLCIQTGSS